MKIIIISNRLPVKIERKGNRFYIEPSAGGLATGLGSLETTAEKYWVGWPGIFTNDEEEKKYITKRLGKMNYFPVFLTAEQIENYYEGYSNSTIWPLCHYFFSYIQYKADYWNAYKEVNALFCSEAIPLIKEGDIIWVQDYQLMLLPKLIRDNKPNASIGYFHHIPFPSYELFRVLPEREEILSGLLGADLVGFHTHDYMRHFISAASRVLDLNFNLDRFSLQNRVVHVETFPMGINYDRYHNAADLPAVKKKVTILNKTMAKESVILSVDRLDYSKGILHRINGFANFLEKHPEYHEKVSLVMIVVPSRDTVDIYADLKIKIEQSIGMINGKYSRLGWTPIYYFYRSFEFNELIAMYEIADIGLITPLRDGMNLVAKEYLATKKEDNPGVLILSEMAGAVIELTDAIIINPNDTDEINNALLQALTMGEDEKRERLRKMQATISRQTVKKWADDFVCELRMIKEQNKEILQKVVGKRQMAQIKQAYDQASHRLLMLDYDGTLAPFVKNPKDAIPSSELIDLLKTLTEDKKNCVVINSGRSHDVLDEWFNEVNVDLAGEHGVFYKEKGKWFENQKKIDKWDERILEMINHTIEKTPKSSLEVKDTALVWHYRNADYWLAELRKMQLIEALVGETSRLNLQILPGNKVVEIRPYGFNKGSEIERRIKQKDYDFILAIGDDTTDEDMFRSLPINGISIKVGNFSPIAKYRIPLQSAVIPFFNKLIK